MGRIGALTIDYKEDGWREHGKIVLASGEGGLLKGPEKGLL